MAMKAPLSSGWRNMNRIFIYLSTVILLSACAAQRTELPITFLGDPIPHEEAEISIEIRPETKWVNVTGGETVRFVVGEKAFGWAFSVPWGARPFDLQRIAPPGMLDRPVTAYVAPDPRYLGGDDDMGN